MKILLITIGKIKQGWFREGMMFYENRLRPFCDLRTIELPEEKISAAVTETEIKKREGENILKQLPSDYFLIALTPDGKKMDSENFAIFLKKVKNEKGGKLAFLIGGPLGLAKEVLQKADTTLSFSELTFPHDLFRILLLEQVYRGFAILAGKKYHK